MVKNNSRRNTKFVSKETIPRFAECSLFGSLWCVNMKSDSIKIYSTFSGLHFLTTQHITINS